MNHIKILCIQVLYSIWRFIDPYSYSTLVGYFAILQEVWHGVFVHTDTVSFSASNTPLRTRQWPLASPHYTWLLHGCYSNLKVPIYLKQCSRNKLFQYFLFQTLSGVFGCWEKKIFKKERKFFFLQAFPYPLLSWAWYIHLKIFSETKQSLN